MEATSGRSTDVPGGPWNQWTKFVAGPVRLEEGPAVLPVCGPMGIGRI
jgi:hypothetical protein